MSLLRPLLAVLACAALQGLCAQTDTLEAPVPSDTMLIVTGGVPEPAITEADPEAPKDSLDWRARHSPHKASLLSAVAPGGGQIYNRKYWKAPIVWAGLGTCIWFIQDNNKQYRFYRGEYLAMVDGDPTTVSEFEGEFSPQQVLEVTNTYRQWRDLSYIILGLVYMLNVVDATVDAHFVRFDVSPDLSLRMGPSLQTAAMGAPGLSLSLVLR
jgi:hypothetical protein